MPEALVPLVSLLPSDHSEKKRGRVSGRWMAFAERPSLNGLWPTVIDSIVTPIFCIEDAWLTDKHTVFSAEVSALARPSGRPTASKAPRTTRCVCRCTR
eukprot:4431261-Prymnesium_polylepis.2